MGALDPDLAEGKRALARRDWRSDIQELEFAAARDPRNADIQNYLGYSYFGQASQGKRWVTSDRLC